MREFSRSTRRAVISVGGGGYVIYSRCEIPVVQLCDGRVYIAGADRGDCVFQRLVAI